MTIDQLRRETNRAYGEGVAAAHARARGDDVDTRCPYEESEQKALDWHDGLNDALAEIAART